MEKDKIRQRKTNLEVICPEAQVGADHGGLAATRTAERSKHNQDTLHIWEKT